MSLTLTSHQVSAPPRNASTASPLRILLVGGGPVFDLGGMGKVVQSMIAELSKEFSLSLAAPDIDAPGLTKDLASCLHHRIKVPVHHWNRAAAHEFVEQVKAEKYDLIHLHGGTFTFDAHIPWRSPLHRLCLAGVPWVLTNHCAPSFTEGLFAPNYPRALKPLKSFLAWASWSFLLSAGQEVFVSDENRGQIDRWFPWAKRKMRTIYPSLLQGSPPKPVLSPEVITIANLGHIAWRKGQHDLLTAFAAAHQKFPQLRLILAGPDIDDGCGAWVRGEIGRLKLESAVQMPGGLTDKSAFWKSVDVYVQPAHYEGSPMSLMEALWQGKPSIGTRVSGIPEMIQHDFNGLLVEPRKPTEMAAAIERLVVESETRRRLSQNAAAYVQSKGMTSSAMCLKYRDLYETICAGSRQHI